MFVYFIILTFNLRVRTENSGGGGSDSTLFADYFSVYLLIFKKVKNN